MRTHVLHFLVSPLFWIPCAFALACCLLWLWYEHGRPGQGAHARTGPEPAPLERTTLLEAPSLPDERRTATCRKCLRPITMLGGDWTCTEGSMYGLTNCGADLSAPYTPHEPVPAPSSSLPYEGDPFAHAGPGMATAEDGDRFIADLRGDGVPVFASVARERGAEPEPAPVPAIPFEPQALEPLPPMAVPPVTGLPGRPVPPEVGSDDETERRYRAAVEALAAHMPPDEVQPEPLPGMPRREMSVMPARTATGMEMPRWAGPAMTDQATGTRMPLEADRMAGVLGKLRAWTPQPAVAQEPAPAPEPVTEDRPVTAGDETREIWLGMARQMNWLTPAEQVALWAREICTPITVGAPQHADGAGTDGAS